MRRALGLFLILTAVTLSGCAGDPSPEPAIAATPAPDEHGMGGMMPGHMGPDAAPGNESNHMLPPEPAEDAWIAYPTDPAGLPRSVPTAAIFLQDGDTYTLTAREVAHDTPYGALRMMAYNDMIPGPEFHIELGATVTFQFENRLDEPSTVHWHGLRLDNAMDGVPGVTQAMVLPGNDFTYTITFDDEGAFWYHPHVNTPIQKERGLYGALIVEAPRQEAWPTEHVVVLDDILLENGTMPHMYRNVTTYATLGRMGGLPFVDGQDTAAYSAAPLERTRLYLVNSANARTFELDFSGFALVEHIGSDISYREAPLAKTSYYLGAGERLIIDVVVASGTAALTDVDLGTLLEITATGTPVAPTLAPDGPHARARAEQRALWVATAEPVAELSYTLDMSGMDMSGMNGMEAQNMVSPPFPTAAEVNWSIVDDATGLDHPMPVFQQGDVIRINLHMIHGPAGMMSGHPFHLHGNRFIIERAGSPDNMDLVWKDTALVDMRNTAADVTILVELSNPGLWVFHCHISEHMMAGMGGMMTVQPAQTQP